MSCPSSVIDALTARPYDRVTFFRSLAQPDAMRWVLTIVARSGRTHHAGDRAVEVVHTVYLSNKLREPPPRMDRPEAWLARLLRNASRDILRREGAVERGGGAQHVEFHSLDRLRLPGEMDHTHQASEADRLQTRQTYNQLARLALHGDIPARPRLAFLGYHLAHAMSSAHVEAAKSETDRAREGTQGGLLRSVEDTWELLRIHVSLPCPEGVDEDEDGQWDLAFALRSAHQGPCPIWRALEEREARTAKDTVRTWAGRGRKRLKELAEANGVRP